MLSDKPRKWRTKLENSEIYKWKDFLGKQNKRLINFKLHVQADLLFAFPYANSQVNAEILTQTNGRGIVDK